MAIYRDEGLVLKTTKLGEADRIITILTREHGKIRAVAKGVRRTKSRFGSRLEPFMRVDLLIAQGRNLDIVSQASSLATYADSISADYDLYTNGGVILETADKLIAGEDQPASDQYGLLLAALAALAGHRHDPRAISASYLMRALALAGWRPRLDSCLVCGRTDDLTYCSVSGGGAMCSADRTTDAIRVDPVTLNQFKALSRGDWRSLGTDPLTPLCDQLVEKWGEYYLERPIHSLRLLDS
ncbi:DNA repair protein RecO [Bifidobacterium coryneforme]|uniref:DNA repair protein RecO n=1 Tax=Bifidobacterium [indicum] DSM 20214 = LMG 11587 TaxID=1341694 RepID=A0A087VTI9_9BIFI|nr:MULTISPECIES: DNA repair protein RecO [Bifidobacterium]AIC91641.1 DNA repair protein RecO [Bifidobacterium indicum LMG 11587 = DSM 20214]AII74439.1 DNA repair protein RecO [Bifidobacterium coryneforme]